MIHTHYDKELESSQNGDELARQNIIRGSRPYILNVVSRVTRKYVTWSDDEASIGLLAFNKAIDSYGPDKGTTFLSYAYCLIKRDLINYYYKNTSHQNEVSLDHHFNNSQGNDDFPISVEEIEISLKEYNRKVESSDLAGEISEFDVALGGYNIGFEELEASSPRHRDTKELIHKIIRDFMRDEELILIFINKKILPATAISKKYGYSLKTIEKHRKFIIAMVVLKLHPEWEYLASYAGMNGTGR